MHMKAVPQNDPDVMAIQNQGAQEQAGNQNVNVSRLEG